MKKLKFGIILLLMATIITPPVSSRATTQTKKMYSHTDKNITFLGRTVQDTNDNATYFNWTCSGFQVHFEGNKLEANIKTTLIEENGTTLYPYIAVFVDDFDQPNKIIKLEKGTNRYTLFESNEHGTHDIKVVKRTEALHSKTALVSLNTYGNNSCISSLPSTSKHNIEFIGDSITCGYGNESNNPADGFRTEQENGWETYAALTARKLNANFNCVSISGIGMTSNWTPENVINDKLLMPAIYKYRDLYLDLVKNQPPTSWDFKQYKPDIVVIGLGLNDMSYMRYDYGNRVEQFKDKYIEFIKTVRECNGTDTKILCLNFFNDTILQNYEISIDNNPIEELVTKYKQQTKDFNIDFYNLAPPEAEDGIGGSFHPTIKSHERMSEGLTIKIRNWLNW